MFLFPGPWSHKKFDCAKYLTISPLWLEAKGVFSNEGNVSGTFNEHEKIKFGDTNFDKIYVKSRAKQYLFSNYFDSNRTV